MPRLRRWFPVVASLLWMGAVQPLPAAAEGADIPIELRRSGLLTLTSDRAVNRVAAKLQRSPCGKRPEPRGGLDGLSLPAPGSFTIVEHGKSVDGTAWFALRSERFPDPPLCAVAVTVEEQTTMIRLYGVADRHREAALKAVHRGDLFCRCKGFRD